MEEKTKSFFITALLYPADNNPTGREMRVRQEYFFVSASLQDIIRRYKKLKGNDFSQLPQKVAVQLNDTHPSLGTVELLRLLVDDEGLPL